MTTADVIALAFALASLIAGFVMLRHAHERNLPRQDDEPC
jgi:hypothetical protein